MSITCPSIVLREIILADFSTWQLDNLIITYYKERYPNRAGTNLIQNSEF